MNRIRDIYSDYCASQEGEAFGEIPEVKELARIVRQALKRTTSKKKRLDVDNNFTECMTAYERQGFIMGFRYAVQLMNECYAIQENFKE